MNRQVNLAILIILKALEVLPSKRYSSPFNPLAQKLNLCRQEKPVKQVRTPAAPLSKKERWLRLPRTQPLSLTRFKLDSRL